MHQTSRLLIHRFTHFPSLSIPPKLPTFFQLHTTTTTASTPLYNYLINHFKFKESKAFIISNRFSNPPNQENLQKVLKYLKDINFTDAQIISLANINPQILFAAVDKTLKPKIDFLEKELCAPAPSLCKFLSENSRILSYSLNKRLKPSIEVIRNVLSKHDSYNASGNDNLFRVLRRCNSLYASRDACKRLVVHVSYLESCGIVGNQLANLFIRVPRLFTLSESRLKSLVLRVLDLGIPYESRMFVHGLHTLGCVGNKNFLKKGRLFSSFGFTENDYKEIFKKAPMLIRVSEKKLGIGLAFFLKTVGIKRSVLICNAFCLMLSMEDRVVARYRVLKLLESKGVLKKVPQFINVLRLSENAFLEKYVSKFPAHVEDLLFQYKGHLLDSSSN